MKIKNVYKLFAIMVLFVTLQSRSTGPGGTANLQVTGAPGSVGSAGTCANAGCHFQGAFSPTASLELLDGTDPVTAYQPGKTYTLSVSIAEGDGSPSGYGFQAAALNGSDSQAGSWGTLGSGQQTITLSGRDYLEHSAMNNSSTFESEWVAPEIGTGEVVFYTAGIAANGNGTAMGDGTASGSLSIGEDPSNSTSDLSGQKASLKVLPNPVYETMNLQINSRIAGDFNVRIMDVMGRVAHSAPVNVQHEQQVANISVSDLLPGLYVVQLCGEGHLAAVQMLKN